MEKCKNCRFFYVDDRITVYRRDPMYFCKRKGVFFSRNIKVHEKNRILPDDTACRNFEKKD